AETPLSRSSSASVLALSSGSAADRDCSSVSFTSTSTSILLTFKFRAPDNNITVTIPPQNWHFAKIQLSAFGSHCLLVTIRVYASFWDEYLCLYGDAPILAAALTIVRRVYSPLYCSLFTVSVNISLKVFECSLLSTVATASEVNCPMSISSLAASLRAAPAS